MRKLLPAVLSSLAFISYGALAADAPQDTSKADKYLSQENKADPAARENVDKNRPARPSPPDASTGPSTPPDAVQDQDDERKASRAKEKMKKKPGYREEAPSPRASHTGMMVN